MKRVVFQKKFQKQLTKLPRDVQDKFWERLNLWQEQPLHSLLNHHVLGGKLAGLHSINITGDIRALYDEIDDTLVMYMLIGSHSQLYG